MFVFYVTHLTLIQFKANERWPRKEWEIEEIDEHCFQIYAQSMFHRSKRNGLKGRYFPFSDPGSHFF